MRSKPTHNEEGTSESKTQTKEKSGGTSQMQGVHFRSKPTDNKGGTSQIQGVHLRSKPNHYEEGTSKSKTKTKEKILGYISNIRGTFGI